MDTRLDQRRQFLQRQFAAEFRGLKIKAASTVRAVISYYDDNIGERCFPASYDRYYDRGERHRSLGRAAMERLGFRKLGNGHFSDVFEHDLVPGYVVKVSWVDGDMGRAWAQWCEGRDDFQFLPKIIDPTMHGNIWTCWMPKYTPLYAVEGYALEQMAEAQRKAAQAVFFEGQGYDTDGSMWMYGNEHVTDAFPEVAELAEIVFASFDGYAVFDLHSDNAMWDEENECIVLTDPLSFPSDKDD